MIMRPGQALLLPANPWFIWGTLLAALVLGMVTQSPTAHREAETAKAHRG